MCEKQVVYRECREPGHKKGDEECKLPLPLLEAQTSTAVHTVESTDETRNKDNRTATRSRPLSRQTTLRPTLELEPSPRSSRNRSETPKRRRSHEARSPQDNGGKQPRRDTGRENRRNKSPDQHRRSDSEDRR